jgi:hypothetical protein
MLSIISIIHKTVVRKFYERNTGFFLFIFFLMFGIVESTQIVYYHLSLIYGLLQSVVFLGIIAVLWVFYMLKCFLFVSAYIFHNENAFLLQLNSLTVLKRIGYLWYVFLMTDLPVIVYVALIVGVALTNEFYVVAAEIVSLHLCLITLAALMLSRQMRLLTPTKLLWPALQLGPLPFPMYYLSALLHNHKMVLFFTKVFSFFAVIGFINIPLDHYEYRTALMGLLFGLAAHAVIVFEFRNLEEKYLPFLRSMPIPLPKRFAQIAMVYLLLLLPENILLMINHFDLFRAVGTYLFSAGVLTLSHCLLYRELNNDKHIQFTLALFLGSFMLVLFQIYVIEVVLLWALAYALFRKHFYQFELQAA